MCSAVLGGLTCTRDHDDRGHVWLSTSGVPDRHSESSGGES